jgi:hypothetical protein
VPPNSVSQDDESRNPAVVSQVIESPTVASAIGLIPIRTMDLYPGSTTTTLNDDAKRILDSLPNFSFMNAKALMFPVRLNGTNHDESPSLF